MSSQSNATIDKPTTTDVKEDTTCPIGALDQVCAWLQNIQSDLTETELNYGIMYLLEKIMLFLNTCSCEVVRATFES